MKAEIENVNKVNSLFTELEPLLTQHFRRASEICDFLKRQDAMLGLTGAGQQTVQVYTPEHSLHGKTTPRLTLIRGGASSGRAEHPFR